MRSIIAIAVLMLCVAAQAAEIRGSVQVQVQTVVTTNASVALVAQTGQTNTYQTGDDGYYQKGVTNPVPRFTIQAETNQVLDNLTGLIWARNGNIDGLKTWSDAITYCDGLTYGGTNDWRLPNVRELTSLIDYANNSPSIPVGHPFVNFLSGLYWTGTVFPVGGGTDSWSVSIYHAYTFTAVKGNSYAVLPVRGGQ